MSGKLSDLRRGEACPHGAGPAAPREGSGEAEGRIVTSLDLTIVVPATPEAQAQGCTCPDPADPGSWPSAMLVCGGHMFSPLCPVHRRAVLAESMRIIGRPQ